MSTTYITMNGWRIAADKCPGDLGKWSSRWSEELGKGQFVVEEGSRIPRSVIDTAEIRRLDPTEIWARVYAYFSPGVPPPVASKWNFPDCYGCRQRPRAIALFFSDTKAQLQLHDIGVTRVSATLNIPPLCADCTQKAIHIFHTLHPGANVVVPP